MKAYSTLSMLMVMLVGLVACISQERTPAASERIVEETNTVETAVPGSTTIVTPILPTPTRELPTPTATVTAVPATSDEPQPFLVEEFNFELTIPAGYVVVEREHPDALLVVSLHEASAMADDLFSWLRHFD